MKKILPGALMVTLVLFALVVFSLYFQRVMTETVTPVTPTKNNTVEVTPTTKFLDDGTVPNVAVAEQSLVDITADLKLPEGFPSDVPVYEGARAYNISSTDDNNVYYVHFLSQAAVDDVLGFYNTELPANGWQMRESLVGTGSTVVAGTKEKRSVSVTVGSSELGTSMLVSYGVLSVPLVLPTQ
ncbi:hypothetical protein ACFL0C_01005 [Patescibacteria group bacterium]